MSIELSMLDMAERGESQGSLAEARFQQPDGRDPRRTLDAMAQVQTTVVQEETEDLGEGHLSVWYCQKLTMSSEQASGPEGLARVKDYDRRFAFYPSFSVERSLALEYRAKCISRLSMEIQQLRGKPRCENAGEPSKISATCVVEIRLEALISKLADSLAQYGSVHLFQPPTIWKSFLTSN